MSQCGFQERELRSLGKKNGQFHSKGKLAARGSHPGDFPLLVSAWNVDFYWMARLVAALPTLQWGILEQPGNLPSPFN